MKPRILLSVNKGRKWYEQAIEACGGVPIAKYMPEVSTDYDGLLLGGGNDIDPKYYGEPLAGSVDMDLPRDEREFALAEAFIKAGKPILGVCRGSQLLNVYFKGTLYQHLPNVDEHRNDDDLWLAHTVYAAKGSIYEKLYGESFAVNSHHHQAVKTLGAGLLATLKSADGVIEGFEHESLPILGAQWHPEKTCLLARREDTVDGLALFRFFVETCK